MNFNPACSTSHTLYIGGKGGWGTENVDPTSGPSSSNGKTVFPVSNWAFKCMVMGNSGANGGGGEGGGGGGYGGAGGSSFYTRNDVAPYKPGNGSQGTAGAIGSDGSVGGRGGGIIFFKAKEISLTNTGQTDAIVSSGQAGGNGGNGGKGGDGGQGGKGGDMSCTSAVTYTAGGGGASGQPGNGGDGGSGGDGADAGTVWVVYKDNCNMTSSNVTLNGGAPGQGGVGGDAGEYHYGQMGDRVSNCSTACVSWEPIYETEEAGPCKCDEAFEMLMNLENNGDGTFDDGGTGDNWAEFDPVNNRLYTYARTLVDGGDGGLRPVKYHVDKYPCPLTSGLSTYFNALDLPGSLSGSKVLLDDASNYYDKSTGELVINGVVVGEKACTSSSSSPCTTEPCQGQSGNAGSSGNSGSTQNNDPVFVQDPNAQQPIGDAYAPHVVTGLGDAASSGYTFSIQPNPSSGLFSLILSTAVGQTLEVIVTDITGRQVHRQQLNGNALRTTIDAASWAPGIYTVSLSGPAGMQKTKLVKQ